MESVRGYRLAKAKSSYLLELRARPHQLNLGPCWSECWNSVTFCGESQSLVDCGVGWLAVARPCLVTKCMLKTQAGSDCYALNHVQLHHLLSLLQHFVLNLNGWSLLSSDDGWYLKSSILSSSLQKVLCSQLALGLDYPKPSASGPLKSCYLSWWVFRHSYLFEFGSGPGQCYPITFFAFDLEETV